MSEALKAKLMAMIESETDMRQRALLLAFVQLMEEIAEQITVPVREHAEDHAFIAALRRTEARAKSGLERLFWGWAEKAGWIGVVWLAVKFGGGS